MLVPLLPGFILGEFHVLENEDWRSRAVDVHDVGEAQQAGEVLDVDRNAASAPVCRQGENALPSLLGIRRAHWPGVALAQIGKRLAKVLAAELQVCAEVLLDKSARPLRVPAA